MTRHWRAALAVVLVLTAAACKEEAKADPVADQTTVDRVVLQRSDLPLEWAKAGGDTTDPFGSQLHGCLAPQGFAPTAYRSSDRYSTAWSRSVYSEATAWPSAGLAHNSLVSITSDSFDVCAIDAVKQFLTSTSIKFVSSSRVDAPVPQRGNGSIRYARTFVIDSPDGKRTEISLDVLRVRRDHLAITCVLLGPGAPLTDITGRDFMDAMLNRVNV